MAARFAPAGLNSLGRRAMEFVRKDHTNFYLKMERYHNEHR
jgi:hypothetical protein